MAGSKINIFYYKQYLGFPTHREPLKKLTAKYPGGCHLCLVPIITQNASEYDRV